jgi:hypothetical protein
MIFYTIPIDSAVLPVPVSESYRNIPDFQYLFSGGDD